MSPGPIAVVNIGSNSIKLLVADRGPDGSVGRALLQRTLEARIGSGIGAAAPRLGEDAMARGLAAVESLLAEARRFAPAQTVLAATSAVRDAANGAEFAERIRRVSGCAPRVLSGSDEAALIGRGLACDPALAGLRNFHVFDLGGGSLECLSFGDREIRQAVSLQLGCVRLTETFVPDPTLPFTAESGRLIARHVGVELARSGFVFDASCPAIGTGGTVATVRAMAAAAAHKPFEETDPILSVEGLRRLLAAVGSFPLDARRRLPGLPPERADVFPAALATLIAMAEAGRFSAFRNSIYTLRWGLVAEALDAA